MEAYACLKEEDTDTSCCCNCIQDVQPRPLDPNDIYQQFHIVPYHRGGQFYANSIAPDGIPPNFLRRKGCCIRTQTPQNYQLSEALGWLGGQKREMYVTRLLSHILRSPESLSLPPDGPNSGYLVIQDKESKTTPFFGFLNVQDLPLPQNKKLHVNYLSDDEETTFVPVVNKPLSSNLYYALKPHGSCKGESYACSKEEDMSSSCCWGNSIQDVEPRPLDPNDILSAISYHSLRKKPQQWWCIFCNINCTRWFSSTPFEKRRVWYCPFMFIKNGTLRDWMKRSMFYEMILEQRWEQIFCCENDYSKGNVVSLDVAVQTEMVIMAGRNAVWDENSVTNGVIWFMSLVGVGEEVNIGLSSLIVDRMKWKQERGG
ncbi:unnamed protein product [Camellia sinensis]